MIYVFIENAIILLNMVVVIFTIYIISNSETERRNPIQLIYNIQC
jgi:hypothetical protein